MYFFNRVILKPSKKLCPSSEKSVNISISDMPRHLLVLPVACLSSALIVPLVASLNILCHTECNADACANVPLRDNSTRVHNPGNAYMLQYLSKNTLNRRVFDIINMWHKNLLGWSVCILKTIQVGQIVDNLKV